MQEKKLVTKDNLELWDDGTVKCPNCNGHSAYIITRVTGYFGKSSAWNKGKIAELKDRHKTNEDLSE